MVGYCSINTVCSHVLVAVLGWGEEGSTYDTYCTVIQFLSNTS